MTSVEFAFVMDATGSMGGYIDAAKKEIVELVKTLKALYPSHIFRFGFVAYRDWSDKEKRLEKLNFTENTSNFQTWVGSVTAMGGGDECEDVLGGLNHAMTLDWSAELRILFHVCDAPPHNKMYHDGAGDTWPDGYTGNLGGVADPINYHKLVLRKMKDKDIQFYIAKIAHVKNVTKMIKVFTEYSDSIDLVCEEKPLKDASELLKAVEEIITQSIERCEAPMDPSMDGTLFKCSTWDASKKPAHDFRAFVGIDFGTDGTGFASALPSGHIKWQQSWNIDSNLKVRTNILLSHVPPHKCIAFGNEATAKYRSSTDKKSLYFERFKMALYDQELHEKKKCDDIKIDDDEKEHKTFKKEGHTSYLRAANGKLVKTEIVFTEALTFIRKVIMKTLDKDYDIKNVSQVQWILTVPAIWSNYAKQLMITSASPTNARLTKKGIKDHLIIATEPECASVVAREKLKLEKGQKYILLDLGGGTADIACHEVVNDTTVKQIIEPQGGNWGSSYIDQAFMKLLEDIFGKSLMKGFKEAHPTQWVSLKENFRKSKHIYKGEETNVSLPNAFVKYINKNNEEEEDIEDIFYEHEYKGGQSGVLEFDDDFLVLPPKVWNDLFNTVLQPICKETTKLLRMTTMRGCKDILIVGGLSDSAYVRRVITDTFKAHYRIHTVERPILAVVEGAARYGLCPSSIAAFSCSLSIGIEIRRDWEETDPASMKKWVKHSKKYVIDGAFFPFVRKGDSIDPTKPPIIEWFRPSYGAKEIKITLYSSTHPDPKYVSSHCTVEGSTTKALPEDWDNKPFPIAFHHKGAEIKLYVAVDEWPEDDREIVMEYVDRI